MPSDYPRTVLADWLVDAKNPYFARASANRLWSYFFGTGLTEPIDDFGAHNPPSYPELLDELARQFILHNFDGKYLIRAITSSRAYQRSSEIGKRGPDDSRLFTRKALRGLSAEQLFDSLAEATEYEDPNPGVSVLDDRNPDRLSPREVPDAIRATGCLC